MHEEQNEFVNKVLNAFRDQLLTPDVALKIHELHMIELDKIKSELQQLVNKVFE